MKKIELLAPAQNKECAFAAINSGADSVYMGADLFGARQNAKNSIEDIKEVVDFAHKFNVKIYVTLNTILDDNELKIAKNIIEKLHKINVDGIIFQDMGILSLDLPDIKLIASTQCNIRSLEKVKFFENLGVKRVILARELDINSIENICKNTNIEIETFIHGALCVCYSGQCYLSYKIGKRSANRGECAQACRKKYTLSDENGKILAKDKYLLSLKDFNASNYLERLINAGVTSFKIEGRLKDASYVKNTVLYYRKLLDEIFDKNNNYKKGSCGAIFADFEPDLNKTFNRGFCSYFLEGRKSLKEEKIYNFDTPNFRGEYLGKVIKKGKNFFELKCEKSFEISPQDGLCFIDGEQKGLLVNSSEKCDKFIWRIFPNNFNLPEIGSKIYRNKDVKFDNVLSKSTIKRKIEAEIVIGQGICKAVDEENNSCTISFDIKEVAKNKQKALDNWILAMKKTNNTIFYVKNVKFTGENVYFLPVSKMNEIRRNVLNELENLRLQTYKKDKQEKIIPAKYPENICDYRLNVHNKKAEEFYNKCGIKVLEKSLESGANRANIELMRTKHCLRYAFNMCLKKNKCNTKLFLTDEKGGKYSLLFDCKNCEMIVASQ